MATTNFTVYTPLISPPEGGAGVHYLAEGATVIVMDMWETTVYAQCVTDSEGKCSITMPLTDTLVHAEHPDYANSGSTFINFDEDRSLDIYLNEKEAPPSPPPPPPEEVRFPVLRETFPRIFVWVDQLKGRVGVG